MGKILIILYVASVLLFSGLSRAQEVDPVRPQGVALAIQKADFQVESYVLSLSGMKPNPCITDPLPQLVQDPKNPNMFLLQAVSRPSTGFCIQLYGNPFELVFDVRSLFAGDKFNLNPEAGLISILIDGTGDVIELPIESLIGLEKVSFEIFSSKFKISNHKDTMRGIPSFPNPQNPGVIPPPSVGTSR